MTDKNQTLDKVIDYDAEMKKNPLSAMIPVKGDKIVHALANDIRKSPIIDKPYKNNIVSLAEGCFYTGKYIGYSLIALKACETLYNLIQ